MEIYIMDADGSNLKRLTNDPGMDWVPAWSPVPMDG
jgi:Tol biopolymer transport system component